MRIEEFKGVSQEFSRARLPKEYFQTDEGGDHYERGAWKIRRGQRRTTITTKASAIETLAGFQAANGDYVVLTVAGTTATSETSVTTF